MVRTMYNELFNKTKNTPFRKQLRNDPTKVEWLLWQELKGSKLGYKFRRQHGIGPFIVDFYCPKLKLVIEVDGETHFQQEDIEYDLGRTSFLIQEKIQVVRVTNNEVRLSMEDVIELIKQQFPKDTNHP